MAGKVELSCPVTQIVYGESGSEGGGITLVLGSGERRRADRVICTASVACLQRSAEDGGGIRFDPASPALALP